MEPVGIELAEGRLVVVLDLPGGVEGPVETLVTAGDESYGPVELVHTGCTTVVSADFVLVQQDIHLTTDPQPGEEGTTNPHGLAVDSRVGFLCHGLDGTTIGADP